MALKELEAWFKDRPKWLQDAAYRLIQNGLLSEQDYADVFTICSHEAAGEQVTFSSIPSGALAVIDTTKPLRLESTSDVQGINALSPSKPLSFGTAPLCIVYGRNGAGKSGYVRLLKHACGARKPGDLLSNIFETTTQAQSAKFTFTENSESKTYQWDGMPISEFQGVEIYDTACGLVYINEENEVAFEPWLLRLFTQLTDACTILSQRIKKRINENVPKRPAVPAEYSTTTAATWYAGITANTTEQEIDEKTVLTAENETELTDISKRLAEPNPTTKAIAVRRQKTVAMELVTEFKKHYKGLSDERCNALLRIKADAVSKRKMADEDARKVFEKAPLTGIGSETWRTFWDAARKYSEEHAYKTQSFPMAGEGARCVLCQRELDKESQDRFISFENFVKGELQRLASDAEKNLQELTNTFTDVPVADGLFVKMEAAGITDENTKSMVIEFASQLTQRRQTCFASDSIADISTLPTNEPLIQLAQIARNLARQARSYDKDSKGQNRPQLEQNYKELSARKWLSQQRKAVEDEINRLKAISLLEEADRLTNTMALSKRKSSLTDELITKAYQERFQDELKHLSASNLSINLDKSRAEVGHVYHRISLKNAHKNVKTSDILSEGEFRIVSLAAFLADTEGRDTKTPFIFDDPISSLDHVFEEATAKRLVKLSESRQVIVFTHRLSFVACLEKYSEKHKIKPSLVCLSEYSCGEIVNAPIERQDTRAAVNALLNEHLNSAKKALREGDAAYIKEAKALCCDIRKLMERIVEKDFLNEVVRRYNQEVQTKGKIHVLAKITEDDCNFVDEYMTRYSRYEHSQPEEAPVPLPRPEEIETDLKAIAEFIDTLKKRKNT